MKSINVTDSVRGSVRNDVLSIVQGIVCRFDNNAIVHVMFFLKARVVSEITDAILGEFYETN